MIILLAVGTIYALWALFLAAMSLRAARERGRLSKTALAFALPIAVAAVLLDVLVNATLATLVFVDLPREWTLSQRLSRYLPQDGWRARVALWVGDRLLDPFDPSGSHLRR